MSFTTDQWVLTQPPLTTLRGVWTTPNLPPLTSPLGPLAFGSPAMRRYCGSDDFRDWRDDWEWTGSRGQCQAGADIAKCKRDLIRQWHKPTQPKYFILSPGWHAAFFGVRS